MRLIRLVLISLVAISVPGQIPVGIMSSRVVAAGGSITFVSPVVGAITATMSGSNLVLPALTTSAGNTIVVAVGVNSVCAGFTPVTVTSQIGGSASGDTFTITTTGFVNSGFSCVGLFVANNVHAGAGNYVITVTVTAGSTNAEALQFSGLSTSAVDKTCSSTAEVNGTPVACASAMTPATSPEVIVAGLLDYYEDTIAAGTGYILPTGGTQDSLSNGKLSMIYKIASPASGTYNPTFTITGTGYSTISGVTLK